MKNVISSFSSIFFFSFAFLDKSLMFAKCICQSSLGADGQFSTKISSDTLNTNKPTKHYATDSGSRSLSLLAQIAFDSVIPLLPFPPCPTNFGRNESSVFSFHLSSILRNNKLMQYAYICFMLSTNINMCIYLIYDLL